MKYIHFLWYVHSINANHNYTTSFTTESKEVSVEEVAEVILKELGKAITDKPGFTFGIKNLTSLPVKETEL